MSNRWQHKVIDVTYKMFGGKTTERVQVELDRMGALGWELVAATQQGPAGMDSCRLFFKKEV